MIYQKIMLFVHYTKNYQFFPVKLKIALVPNINIYTIVQKLLKNY